MGIILGLFLLVFYSNIIVDVKIIHSKEELRELLSEQLKEQNQQSKEDLTQVSLKYTQTKSQQTKLVESINMLKNHHFKMK